MLNFQTRILRFKSSPLAKRLTGAAFWSLAGAGVQKVLLLLTSIFCVRMLGKEGFGELGIVRSTIHLFIVFGALGMGNTATKFIAEYRERAGKDLQSIYTSVNLIGLLMGSVAVIGVLVFADAIAEYLQHPELTPCIRVGAILLFFSIITSIQTGVLSGFERFQTIAFNTAIGGVAEFVFIVSGARMMGVMGALLGYGLGFIVLTLLNHWSIRKALRGTGVFFSFSAMRVHVFRYLLFFSIPLMFSSLMVGPTNWMAQSMVVRAAGFGELGVYNALDQWRMAVLFLPSALARIVLPILSNLYGAFDVRSYTKVLRANLLLNGGVTFLIFLVFALCSPLILKTYAFSYDVLPVFLSLMLTPVFSSLAMVVGQAITSRSKVWIGLLFNLGWAIIVLLSTHILLKHQFGALSLAIAYLVAYIIHTGIQMIYLSFILQRGVLERESQL